ncbi:MAG: helix-turn-helix transcriptional regulator [Thermodesulfovibrionales bacterium]|nr:helix-turn-helix transcriptional regulator [Thermodesulfovibrionales bacterium]
MKEWTPDEIKEFRQRKGLYQKDLAKMLRVTTQYVCNLEKGVRKPSNTMKALLDCLEKDVGKEVLKRHGKDKGNL